jgi:hypothetical protein
MTGQSDNSEMYHDLAAMARQAAAFASQIAPGRLDAYLGTSTILASVLAEFGVAAIAAQGLYGTEQHSWLEVDGFRIDIARELIDGGPLVEPITEQSAYVAQTTFPACWMPEESVAQFAGVFDYPAISAQRGWWIFDYLLEASFLAERQERVA